MAVWLKSPDEIEAMARAGGALWAALRRTVAGVLPGQTSRGVAEGARQALIEAGLEPILGGYAGGAPAPFPAAACVCINEEVVHAVPSDRIIRDGDLVTVDVAGRLDGWCADAATSLIVGAASAESRRLIESALRVVEAAIAQVGPGVRWSRVAHRAALEAGRAGVTMIAGYDGHGIGRALHEPPRAALAGGDRGDFVLRPGMVLTVEPVLTSGSGRTLLLDDGWTVLTQDRAPACHEERTLAVTRDGCRVLTTD